MIAFALRCRAFSTEASRKNLISVDGNEVRVWDSTAHHYTACHTLSACDVRVAKMVAQLKRLSPVPSIRVWCDEGTWIVSYGLDGSDYTLSTHRTESAARKMSRRLAAAANS